MSDRDDTLLKELARRNWIILAVLVLLSLIFGSKPTTLGVLSGGTVAIIGYYWLQHSLVKLLTRTDAGASRGFKATYIVRLGALAAVLFLLVAIVRVHPVGLAVGLSVVVINIFCTTVKRSF